MARAWIALLIATSASVVEAGTICRYGTSYNDPGIGGACFVDAVAGCPIHLVEPHQPPPVDLMPVVYRGGQPVDVTATTEVVGMVSPLVTTIDYYSCSCDRTTAPYPFDQLAVTIAGLRAGDEVYFGQDMVTVGPAGPCPVPDWPSAADFEIETGGCDLCPSPPPDAGGCGATPSGGGPLAAASALVAIALRRRRAGPRLSSRRPTRSTRGDCADRCGRTSAW